MYEVVTEIHFDSAHRLTFHKGHCNRLHGHRWIVQCFLKGNILKDNMIIDFKWLKEVMKGRIEKVFDHKTILFDNSINKKLIELLEKNNEVVVVPFEPTAEHLSKEFYYRIFDGLKALGKSVPELEGAHKMLSKVRVYESPTSFADFYEN